MSRPMLPEPDADGGGLPVAARLPAFIRTLLEARAAVLVAPPGTGKTSLLPLALADAVPGRVLVAEPRRIATRAAARRMADLIGEPVGQRIGFSVRGDRRVSAATEVEVVTTGLLLQRLQADPDLPGVDAVVIDECHERHLDSDLALAFLLDIRASVRDDLLLVAASATPDAGRLAAALGSADAPAPVVVVQAELHPLVVEWATATRPVPLAADRRVAPAFLDFVAATVRRAAADSPDGDVLVFLPGEGEIRTLARRLSGLPGRDVLSLYGRQPAAEQDAVLTATSGARIVLSTAVAESSLTVPGVRCVVDAGLSREPRTDHSRGLSTLITTRVSRSSADQRAGRAARLGPGRVYRCWSEADHVHLADHPEPEIAVADLTDFALTVARWGNPAGVGLSLLDSPPAVALTAATEVLRGLGAIDASGRPTDRGRAIGRVAAHPRLARALLDGSMSLGRRRAAEVVAILSEDGLADRAEDDLTVVWRGLRAGRDRGRTQRWRAEIDRLARSAAEAAGSNGGPASADSDDLAAALVVGLAFPERLSRARAPDSTQYLSAGGTGAELSDGSSLRGSGWLAVAVADRQPGRRDARVRLAVATDEDPARAVAAPLLDTADEISWAGGELRMQRVQRLGAIELRRWPVTELDPTIVATAFEARLRSAGDLDLLGWSAADQQLRWRLATCFAAFGPPWPDMSTEALLDRLPDWLGPDLARVRRRADLAEIDVGRALRRLLPWSSSGSEAARFDELVPERLEVPSGSRVRLAYSPDGPPVLAVKLQELFGWEAVPRLVDGRTAVVVHLLSPAGRPVAITADLASFWAKGYPQVRGELRGRYPRHPWPEDPTTAPPTRRISPRGGR